MKSATGVTAAALNQINEVSLGDAPVSTLMRDLTNDLRAGARGSEEVTASTPQLSPKRANQLLNAMGIEGRYPCSDIFNGRVSDKLPKGSPFAGLTVSFETMIGPDCAPMYWQVSLNWKRS